MSKIVFDYAFQSHSGSIKTQAAYSWRTQARRFQSHSGSIKTCVSALAGAQVKGVSIPLWFD